METHKFLGIPIAKGFSLYLFLLDPYNIPYKQQRRECPHFSDDETQVFEASMIWPKC
jgi:hypothetical protein